MTVRIAILLLLALAGAPAQTHWIATWGASPAPQLADDAQMRTAKLEFNNQTLREIVHTSAGGSSLRLRLSNAYGKGTLQIAGVHVALSAKESAIVPASDRAVTFGGRPAVSIPADALVLSDPVKLDLPAGAGLAVSIFVPGVAAGSGTHYSAMQTCYIGAGDQTGAAAISNPDTVASWIFLTEVEVQAPAAASTVVAFGDSITDGARSTTDANHRWPDVLAGRLLARRGAAAVGVLNAGIGGNRILHDPGNNIRFGVNALARFDRDVLTQAGVRYLVILEGINDLGHPGSSAPLSETVSAEDLIGGIEQMIDRAHEKGIKVFLATILPFEGAAYYSTEKDAKRKTINDWIRAGKGFDGTIDFEKATRDPEHPARLLPAYDSGDHLHPSDAGYRAMGEAIDLSLFR
jgi:lysophospholipase L1-like esterase